MHGFVRCAVCGVVVLLAALMPLYSQGQSKTLQGTWHGQLKFGDQEIGVVFHVAEKDGKLSAKMDIPDQGAKGLAVDEVTHKDGKVRFELMGLGYFEGKLTKEAIVGEWHQGGITATLTLTRTDKLAEAKPQKSVRPQEPKPPFPYLEEEVTYENKKANIKLAGTLTMPKGKGPFPAVLLLAGSGPNDRNEKILGHKPFMVIADYLTRRGLAVLRVDKRGVGGSTGNINTSTTADFAEDALVGVAFLKARKEIDGGRIGLLGHSEGGMTAPLAAAQSKDVAFIVMLAGPGVPCDDILVEQTQLLYESQGKDKASIDAQVQFLKLALPRIKKEADVKVVEKQVLAEYAKLKDKADAEEKKRLEAMEKKIAGGSIRTMSTNWYRYFLNYDPAPVLRKVQCPVLAINGEKDRQVPSQSNLQGIAKALREGGNKDVTIKEFAATNHLLQSCQTGYVSEYGQIEETMAPAVLQTVTEWILARVKKE